MNVPVYEQETTINIYRDSKEVEIWTSDRTMMTRLNRMVETSEHYSVKEVAKDRDGDVIGKIYVLDDKSLLSFRGKKVVMSAEQKAKLAERLNFSRNAQSGGENENAE